MWIKVGLGLLGLVLALPLIITSGDADEEYFDISGRSYDDVYNEYANPASVLKSAIAKARSENKKVFISWGANWCPACREFSKFKEANKRVFFELRENYVAVSLNVDLNSGLMSTMNSYSETIPFVTVLDSNGVKITDKDPTEFFDEKIGFDPDVVMAFLQNPS